jgi:DNA modification methylase
MNGFKNLLICGDNLRALDDLKAQGIRADLIYLDPPFFSNKHYEVIWGDEAEVRSFKDRWEGGVNVYIEWMKERVSKMYDVLKDTGSFYLHCDWHASHYLKMMLDEVFGYNNFQNEIIWCYEIGARSKKRWGRKHDVLLFYSKSEEFTFNVKDVVAPRKNGTHMKVGTDGEGRPYQEKADRKSGKVYRYYLDEGTIPPDWWVGIQQLNREEAERLGYPTQKPEKLLERIIKASSNEKGIVLDPFCGCGTAMAVAQRLKRNWIGIDISPTAINLIEKRLKKIGAVKGREFDSVGMPTTIAELKSLEPFEFQNWVINEMKAKQSKKLSSDFGLDGYYDKTIFTERAGIQVKQSESIGRNVVDNFETALTRGKFKKGFVVAFSFTKGAHEESARVKGEGLEIKLIKVEDLLLRKVKII